MKNQLANVNFVLQDIFNLLPNIDAELNRSFAVKSNDMMLVVYVASLIRSVLALHNLINNKVWLLLAHRSFPSASNSILRSASKFLLFMLVSNTLSFADAALIFCAI